MSKFNFKTKGGARVYRKWFHWEVGDYVVGTLESVGLDKYGKNNYTVKVIETSLDAREGVPTSATNATLMDLSAVEVGQDLCLNANGSLDYKMQDVVEGTVIRVEYEGETMLDKGPFKGKTCHTVELQIDDSGVTPAPVAESFEEEDELGL